MAFLQSKKFLFVVLVALSFTALLLTGVDLRRAVLAIIPYGLFMGAVIHSVHTAKRSQRRVIEVSLNDKLDRRMDLMLLNSGLPDRGEMLREMFSTYEFYVSHRVNGAHLYAGNAEGEPAVLTRFIPPRDEDRPSGYDTVDQMFADMFQRPPREPKNPE